MTDITGDDEDPTEGPASPLEEFRRLNEILPYSDGGLIEAVKTAMIDALRETFEGMEITNEASEVHVNFEYPMMEEEYPSIWVQFSLTQPLQRAGVAHEVYSPIGEPIQEWTFVGRMTFTIVALSSLVRDKIADTLIVNLAFARPMSTIITQPQKDVKQYRTLLSYLAKNPYISMTINTDKINPGGQSITVGVPWEEDIIAYEDTYSIELEGQFNVIFKHEGPYILRDFDIEATRHDPFDWQ